MPQPFLKSVSKGFTILFIFVTAIQAGYAQTAFDAPASAASDVVECDDSQNAPDTATKTAIGTTIVERLSLPASGVTVEGPAALMQRALPTTAAQHADTEVVNPDEADDDAETERVVRTKSGKTVGFRVQVYTDNNVRSAKVEARQRERAIGQQFPAYSTYVSYASPYWRLRVGDFSTQYDAEKAASEIRKAFPRYAREVRVVRDRINAR